MLLQMFELLNKLRTEGDVRPTIAFSLHENGFMNIEIVEALGEGTFCETRRSFTGGELLLVAGDDSPVLDRMSKAFLIEFNRTRNHNPA